MEQTLEMSKELRDVNQLERLSFEFPKSRFTFINDHYGLRKGKVHTLISSSGVGKSTLSRSLIFDMAKENKVFLYSTEEDLKDTQTMFAMRDADNAILKNIIFCHEGDLEKETSDVNEWLRLLEVKIKNSKCDILFFDNITTSSFYETKKPDVQAQIFSSLRVLARDCAIPLFLIAHTASTVRDDSQTLIRAEDIFGSKSPSRKSQFLYVYQRIIGQSSPTGLTTPSYPLIRVLKARGYDTQNIYLLGYDFQKNEYTGDAQIPNAKFKEIYDERFKLGK